MDDRHPDDRALLALTPKCIVTVRADGTQVQQKLESEPRRLGYAELELLAMIDAEPVEDLGAAVDAVAARTGVDRSELADRALGHGYGGRVAYAEPIRHRPIPDHPTLRTRPAYHLEDPVRVVVRTPLVLRLHQGRFEVIDHDGLRTLVLTPAEVHALDSALTPATPRELLARLGERSAAPPVDEHGLADLLGRLDGAGLLRRVQPEEEAAPASTVDHTAVVSARFEAHAAAQDAAERARVAQGGRPRTKVIPVAFDAGTPAGLGMVVAYAKAFDGGRLEECYDFRTDWVWDDGRLEQFTAEPAIYLFSNYLWSHAQCIAVSRAVKERSPGSITIHGGPDTPKYERDTTRHLKEHPHIDIAIRGEGEVSAAETLAALAPVIGDPFPDLSVLEDVAGITYRDGDRIVRTEDRPRVADLDTLPSPFLTGLFDVFRGLPDLFVTIETNRGCPYGCTFCDWGSATTSRVRQYDLDRVLAELDWVAAARAQSVSVADANFGMFKRDVEIAQHVADLCTAQGHPKAFGVSYAKNTVKHLQQIIRILSDAGIMSQGVLSLQSMDTDTLAAIHRSNIKTERYDALADEMRHAELPLMVELMMGLPGQTVASVADDLQQCIDREVPARVNRTTLLVNSPMNDPEYLAEHQVQVSAPVGPGQTSLVVSTSSFTSDDYLAMEDLRLDFLLCENWGALRHVARFVRHETGRREIDVYRAIRAAAEDRPSAWPILFALTRWGTSMMAPPYSWALVMDELRDYLTAELDVPAGDPLDAVLRTQQALLPSHGRAFPELVPLPHDVAAWHRAILSAKGSGHRTDWTEVVPHLADFGPTELRVDDPEDRCATCLGVNRELTVFGLSWELDSPLSRARIAAGQLADWATERVFVRPKQAASLGT
jgi:hypothetical protein